MCLACYVAFFQFALDFSLISTRKLLHSDQYAIKSKLVLTTVVLPTNEDISSKISWINGY